MILGFVLLQAKSSKEVGYGNQNEIEICVKEQYFPKPSHGERTLALASQYQPTSETIKGALPAMEMHTKNELWHHKGWNH